MAQAPAKADSPKKPVPPKGLVDVRELDASWIIDMRYATDNNTRGVAFYPTDDCFLREGTAKKLLKAEAYLAERGYHLMILDAYRPQSVVQWLWDTCPVERRQFLANPKKGSNHTRGSAVDVTLADENGNELEMQSGYDDSTEKASRKYDPGETLKARTELLTKAMKKAGFKTIELEWWHYSDSKSYSLIKE
jgi:D-alanyl-D-alanine dipeptidase